MNESFARPGGREDIQERRRLARQGRISIAVYLLGATAGGAMTGLVISHIGTTLREWSPAYGRALLVTAVVPVVVLACVLQWQGRMRPLVERRAQVPRRWLLWRRPVMTAGAFGFVLGSGVFTYLHHAAAYVLGAALLLAPTRSSGLLLGALYGSSWGWVLVYQSLSGRGRSHSTLRERSMYDRKTLRTLALAGVVSFSLVVFGGGPIQEDKPHIERGVR
jgi:hypothetical protein